MNIPLVQSVAEGLGVPARALGAMLNVESSGAAFSRVGDHFAAVIRVEAHLLLAGCPALASRFRVKGPHLWEGHTFDGAPYHGDQVREWAAFGAAAAVDEEAAVQSTSWGAGQVLGAWRELGFESRSAFLFAQASEAGQLDTMGRYIRVHGLIPALAALDWHTVARVYNGTGQVDVYAARLATAYAALTQLAGP